MSADRELLELAAKAAGIEINVKRQSERDAASYGHVGLWTKTATNWNPLTDDGDALRLAVKLGLYLEIDRPNTRASALPEQDDMEFKRERFNGDPCAALRRAIVRAAAEIGKAMP